MAAILGNSRLLGSIHRESEKEGVLGNQASGISHSWKLAEGLLVGGHHTCLEGVYTTAVASISIKSSGKANLDTPSSVPLGWQPASAKRLTTASCASK